MEEDFEPIWRQTHHAQALTVELEVPPPPGLPMFYFCTSNVISFQVGNQQPAR